VIDDPSVAQIMEVFFSGSQSRAPNFYRRFQRLRENDGVGRVDNIHLSILAAISVFPVEVVGGTAAELRHTNVHVAELKIRSLSALEHDPGPVLLFGHSILCFSAVSVTSLRICVPTDRFANLGERLMVLPGRGAIIQDLVPGQKSLLRKSRLSAEGRRRESAVMTLGAVDSFFCREKTQMSTDVSCRFSVITFVTQSSDLTDPWAWLIIQHLISVFTNLWYARSCFYGLSVLIGNFVRVPMYGDT
jgi:hypothetical protein